MGRSRQARQLSGREAFDVLASQAVWWVRPDSKSWDRLREAGSVERLLANRGEKEPVRSLPVYVARQSLLQLWWTYHRMLPDPPSEPLWRSVVDFHELPLAAALQDMVAPYEVCSAQAREMLAGWAAQEPSDTLPDWQVERARAAAEAFSRGFDTVAYELVGAASRPIGPAFAGDMLVRLRADGMDLEDAAEACALLADT